MSKYVVEEICYQATRIFTIAPFLYSFNFKNKTNISANEWKSFYLTKNVVKSYFLNYLNSHPEISKTSKQYVFNSKFFAWFTTFCEEMRVEVDNLRVNTVDVSKFFGVTRLNKVLSRCIKDDIFSYCMPYSFYISTEKINVNKEELYIIIDLFFEVMRELYTELYNIKKNEELLTKLSLPLDTKELTLLIENTTDLGELFSWSRTPQGFAYWANKYLGDQKEYFIAMKSFLKTINPELEIKTLSNHKEIKTTVIKRPTLFDVEAIGIEGIRF